MKVLALLLVSFAAVCSAAILPWNNNNEKIAKETIELALKTADKCTASTGISEAAVEALKNGDFLKQDVDETSKLFVQCYLEGLGFLENGKGKVGVIMKRLGAIVGKPKVIMTLAKCGLLGGDNELDKTFNIYTCFFNNDAVVLK